MYFGHGKLKRRTDFTRIIAYIVLSTSFIFIIDVITPLGVCSISLMAMVLASEAAKKYSIKLF